MNIGNDEDGGLYILHGERYKLRAQFKLFNINNSSLHSYITHHLSSITINYFDTRCCLKFITLLNISTWGMDI